jgi:Zn-dependent protease/CBS domain-containing protein
MFGRRIALFKLFGFEVSLDLSWVFLGLLVTWSLATGYFPDEHEGLPSATYWLMGIAGAFGLFLSIIFHEMSHSLVARRYGLSIRGITLFIFGGVAELEEEPANPKTEFMMAIAGPIASLVLAGLLMAVYFLLESTNGSYAMFGVCKYLAFLNTVLAIFNMVPAFPLDGGRVLRSVLWHWKGDLRWATRICSKVGSTFGTILILMGVLSIFRGEMVSGIWFGLIGLFIRFAAAGSYYSVISQHTLEGEAVHRFMVPDPVSVAPDLTLKDLMEKVFYQYLHDLYPVVAEGHLVGSVGPSQIKGVPSDQWANITVAEVMAPLSGTGTIAYNEDAVLALSKMRQPGNSRLMVVKDNQLVGIVALKDMLKFLSLKVEFDDVP